MPSAARRYQRTKLKNAKAISYKFANSPWLFLFFVFVFCAGGDKPLPYADETRVFSF